MKVVATAVGQRTEHWIDLFTALAAQPDIELTIVVADVSPLTVSGLQRLAQCSPAVHVHHLPHALSEARTGHMASIVIRPAALRRLDIAEPDAVHIIGEPSYMSTTQIVRHRNRHWPSAPITHYAAQNIVIRLPLPFPLLERRAYRSITHMLPITPAALHVVREKGYSGPATIVPLGVDVGAFTPGAVPHADRPFTIGFVGRLEPHKGVADLLLAAERLDCRLIVVGDGSMTPTVLEAASQRPDRITLHPWVDHERLPELLGDMDVLTLPSTEVVQRNVLPWIGIPLREQFGRVLVEAMACGVPVVGSDVGEIPHVIGAAGLLHPAGDVDGLVDRLAELRDHPGEACRLAALGIDRARAVFAWDRIAADMCTIWNDLCTPSRHRRTSSPATTAHESTPQDMVITE